MSVLTNSDPTQVEAPTPDVTTSARRDLPSVNLLPQSIRQRFAIRRVIRRGIVGGAALVAAASVLWWSQNAAIGDARAELTAAQDVNSELRERSAALAPLGTLSSALTRTQEFVEAELRNQPDGSAPIARLVELAASLRGPAVPISSVSISYHGLPSPGDDLNPCPSPNPFDTEITTACMSFSAVAKSREQVSALLRALESDPLFVGPYVTGTSISTDIDGSTNVAVSGTVGIAPSVLKNPPSDEELTELTQAVPSGAADEETDEEGSLS